jgi:4a-hydroxytetrahydrobiopterin dehydratase
MARDRTKLTDAELQTWLSKHPGWTLETGMIRRTFIFPDFRGSMAFVNRVADAAEKADHHPDVDIRYAKVTLALSTHDAGGLTSRDTGLAEKVDGLATA